MIFTFSWLNEKKILLNNNMKIDFVVIFKKKIINAFKRIYLLKRGPV